LAYGIYTLSLVGEKLAELLIELSLLSRAVNGNLTNIEGLLTAIIPSESSIIRKLL